MKKRKHKPSQPGSETSTHHLDRFVGRICRTACPLHPIGFVQIEKGEWIEALSEHEYLPKATLAKVLRVDINKNRLIVCRMPHHAVEYKSN